MKRTIPFSTAAAFQGYGTAMLSSLKRFFAAPPSRLAAQRLYMAAVEQARLPVFYRDWDVPDTLDGRFDMIVLHLFLLVARLEGEAVDTAINERCDTYVGREAPSPCPSPASRRGKRALRAGEGVTPFVNGCRGEFVRTLSEAFFDDMDRNLREMGASDTGVGVRVKKMAQAYYGRLKAYGDAMHDAAQLAAALQRNVWREEAGKGNAAALAQYMQRSVAHLRSQDAQAIMRGEVRFAS